MTTTSDTLDAAIERVPVHDHLCLIYESQAEQFAAVVPFVRSGLEAGQRCVYIADDNAADEVVAALSGSGVDVEAETGRGALRVLTKRESYLRGGRFDPDEMIAFLADAVDAAKADGFSALRVTGEMTWVLGGAPGTERLFEYEAKLNRFFPGHDALAVCQYNRARFPPDMILDVIRTHPVVISDGVVSDNFYYVPPEEYLDPGEPSREVERMLAAVKETSASRGALEHASAAWSATFDAMTDAVGLLDLEGTVVRCNSAMAALVGRDLDEVVGATCHDLVHGSDSFLEGCPYQKMLRTGKPESLEMSLADRWFQVTADPLVGRAGELVGAVHVVRDITERRRVDEALARKTESPARMNEFALELASLPSGVALGGYLADRLRQLTGAVGVTFGSYDRESKQILVHELQLEPGALATLTAPLAHRLRGVRAPVDDAMYAEIVASTVGMRRTLTETTFGAIPPAVGVTVQKLLRLDRFIGLAYVVEGELYGTSVIALRAGQPDPPPGLLESFAGMTAVTLRRRRAEEELIRASAYNRRLIEASLDPLVTIDPDGTITDANAAASTVTGRPHEELIGTDFADCFTDPDRARAGYEHVFRDGSAHDLPLKIRHRDGHVTEVLYNASVFRNADGRVAGIFAAARDVGALRQAEREIRALNANLERRVDERTRELAAANRELQEFIYSVSHDLRTPLRAVDGFSQTVIEDYGEVLGEQGQGDLRRVRKAAQRMGELIDALLSLSRLRGGRVALADVDLSVLARRAAAELMSADPERTVELKIADGLVAEADAALLAIVVENLLSNAWKFTAGESEARIEVGVEKREGRPVFFVRDNGCGFDPAYAHKLFTPFQRLHAADEYSGTGIGLATVARVLERMGGSYWAESRPGEGATFFFTLAGAHESTDPGNAATAETR